MVLLCCHVCIIECLSPYGDLAILTLQGLQKATVESKHGNFENRSLIALQEHPATKDFVNFAPRKLAEAQETV